MDNDFCQKYNMVISNRIRIAYQTNIEVFETLHLFVIKDENLFIVVSHFPNILISDIRTMSITIKKK